MQIGSLNRGICLVIPHIFLSQTVRTMYPKNSSPKPRSLWESNEAPSEDALALSSGKYSVTENNAAANFLTVGVLVFDLYNVTFGRPGKQEKEQWKA